MTSEAAQSRAPAGADGGFTHRQILTILSGLMLGMFLAALDMTVVSVAIRTIADELAGSLPDATVTVIEGAGHAAHLEHPDRILALLRPWLTARLTSSWPSMP